MIARLPKPVAPRSKVGADPHGYDAHALLQWHANAAAQMQWKVGRTCTAMTDVR